MKQKQIIVVKLGTDKGITVMAYPSILLLDDSKNQLSLLQNNGRPTSNLQSGDKSVSGLYCLRLQVGVHMIDSPPFKKKVIYVEN